MQLCTTIRICFVFVFIATNPIISLGDDGQPVTTPTGKKSPFLDFMRLFRSSLSSLFRKPKPTTPIKAPIKAPSTPKAVPVVPTKVQTPSVTSPKPGPVQIPIIAPISLPTPNGLPFSIPLPVISSPVSPINSRSNTETLLQQML
jgi:hypothetical protein